MEFHPKQVLHGTVVVYLCRYTSCRDDEEEASFWPVLDAAPPCLLGENITIVVDLVSSAALEKIIIGTRRIIASTLPNPTPVPTYSTERLTHEFLAATFHSI